MDLGKMGFYFNFCPQSFNCRRWSTRDRVGTALEWVRSHSEGYGLVLRPCIWRRTGSHTVHAGWKRGSQSYFNSNRAEKQTCSRRENSWH